ncbi:hypothetical protein [Moorena sp. SIO4G3]|uniref:hypothetical protein n=1 Tax=Moorena sp. SIO4G3 TaxID=2607821 RepID=UPI0014298D49|nr:hypothetical protein [Moorena sp. SIO4G3]NEO80042.1 hypothetical protein [Moorena sp. SIO4G3]
MAKGLKCWFISYLQREKIEFLYCSGAEGHPGDETLEEWSLNHKVLTKGALSVGELNSPRVAPLLCIAD